MADARQIYRARPTSDEIRDVLGLRETATVGTVNEDGSVHLAFVIFLHQDGRLYFETSSVTRKARNIEREQRVSMIVQGRATTGRSLMVSAEGSGRILSGTEAQRINHQIRAKYVRPDALDQIDSAWNRFDDIAVEVTPVTWRSWTGSTMRDETQRALSVPYDDVWLPDD
jgi:nitroimidazol reductase NimA-like FMN-containing flavoprotein (pyridoxamine 5'-phosphate oxidase superfamily)